MGEGANARKNVAPHCLRAVNQRAVIRFSRVVALPHAEENPSSVENEEYDVRCVCAVVFENEGNIYTSRSDGANCRNCNARERVG